MTKDTNSLNDMEDSSKAEQASEERMSAKKQKVEKSTSDYRDHLFECRSCGYIYDPDDGVKKLGIPRGTSFIDLDQAKFICPVCRVSIDGFRDIGPKSKPSGFEENLNYGFGVNTLTPGQKNVLIFGGLAFALACFLSLYSLN